MKRILPAGERYALFNNKISGISILLVLWTQVVFSQQAQTISHVDVIAPNPISSQQRVPTSFWTHQFQMLVNDQVKVADLKDYQGFPTILVFWSTTCGVCFSSFDILKEMLSEHEGELKVLLVNSIPKDSEERVRKRIAKLDPSLRFDTVFQDDYLHKLFPHGPLPFYVWIYPNGRVDAITSQAFLTRENISKFADSYEKK